MTTPYVISVLITTGDPDGVRIVEKSNWTGRGLVFSRTDITSAANHNLNFPGVYILIGEDLEGNFDECIYIGQGENVLNRLRQHIADQTKDFWTSTVVFTSKDMALNRADILYLEHKLLSLADEARQVRVMNGNRPSAPVLSMIDKAKADGFLSDLLGVLPVIGVAAFELPSRERSATKTRFLLTGPDTRGEGQDHPNGFLVFAGATGRIQNSSSLSDSFRRIRERLVDAGLFVMENNKFKLTQDHLFSSPSTAAMALLGRHANGRTEWRDESGTMLKEYQEREVGGLSP